MKKKREHVREDEPSAPGTAIQVLMGTRLREWRRAHGVPMKRLASDLGVSISAISSWEGGLRFPGVGSLIALAEYTGIPACHFVCREDECDRRNARRRGEAKRTDGVGDVGLGVLAEGVGAPAAN